MRTVVNSLFEAFILKWRPAKITAHGAGGKKKVEKQKKSKNNNIYDNNLFRKINKNRTCNFDAVLNKN